MTESEYKALKKGIIERLKAGDTAAMQELERLEKLWMTQLDHESIRQKNENEILARKDGEGLKAATEKRRLDFDREKFEKEQAFKETELAWKNELEKTKMDMETLRFQNELILQKAERRNKIYVALIGATGGVAAAAATFGTVVYKEHQKNKRVDAITAFESTGSATSLAGKNLLNEGFKD